MPGIPALAFRSNQQTLKGQVFTSNTHFKLAQCLCSSLHLSQTLQRLHFQLRREFSQHQKSWKELLPRQPIGSILFGFIHFNHALVSLGGCWKGAGSKPFQVANLCSPQPLSLSSSGRHHLVQLTAASAAGAQTGHFFHLRVRDCSLIKYTLQIQRNGVFK